MVELHQQTQVLLSMQEDHSGEENTSTVQRVAMCSLHQKVRCPYPTKIDFFKEKDTYNTCSSKDCKTEFKTESIMPCSPEISLCCTNVILISTVK